MLIKYFLNTVKNVLVKILPNMRPKPMGLECLMVVDEQNIINTVLNVYVCVCGYKIVDIVSRPTGIRPIRVAWSRNK